MTIMSGGDEGQRQAYLAALGLPLWTARYDLPGAASSLPLMHVPFCADIPDAAELPVVSMVPVAPETALSDQGAPVSEVSTAPLRQERKAPVMPIPAAAVANPVSVNPAFPRFALRVQALAPGWLAIIALGDVPDLSAQEYRLVSGISHVLGAAPDFSGPASLLRWPLNSNPRLDHGAGAAVEWLSHALKVPEGWRCLVLGESVAVHVRAALPAATVMVAGPALATLLAMPQTKKSLWLSLHA
ncbi:MAG: hypothetical protein Q7T32_02415 [Moraxellaceae bacterium]|nr:hypothetical protein [Moraxellaceae bacterium]